MAAPQAQQLLPGERVVSSTDLVTLTNYRVFRDTGSSGQSRYISITLDAVSSCGLVTTSQPILIILGIIAMASAAAVPADAQIGAVIAGAILIIMYFATLSAVLAVCSTGGERITVPAKAKQRPLLMTLLNAIDREKLAALGRIGNGQHVDVTADVMDPAPVRSRASAGSW